ncbi:MAG: gamma-glutamyl-gamma-aminobutyrate hydrolase family protein [Solirubrobacteraceae bacterium]
MGEQRPVIGLVAALEQAQYSGWDVPCVMLQHAYLQAVQRAGAMAIMIPPDPVLCEDPDAILDRIDGLLLAGGSDLDPATYGQRRHPQTLGIVHERDAIELALITRAIERDLPALCICRGMQVLNVALGGTLVQHLPDLLRNEEHRRHPGTFDGNEHDVRLDSGSVAAKAAGAPVTMTKSHHHQGIDRLGAGLVVSGHSTLDELPEAIELPGSSYVLGVQWHPEADVRSHIVESLVAAVRAQRTQVTSA